jgi:hypothetical protein
MPFRPRARCCRGHGGVSARGVTRLAEQRGAPRQHRPVNRAVRVVADRAILGHRRMLPDERAALLGVAAVAGLVQRAANQQAVGAGAVRIVAIRARQLSLPHRVGRRLEEVRLDVGVAGIARLGLGALLDDRVLRRMQLVAVGAGDGVDVVRAAGPLLGDVAGVTAEAHLVLLRHRGPGVRAEIDDRRARLAAGNAAAVRGAGAVAGLALQLALAEGLRASCGLPCGVSNRPISGGSHLLWQPMHPSAPRRLKLGSSSWARAKSAAPSNTRANETTHVLTSIMLLFPLNRFFISAARASR